MNARERPGTWVQCTCCGEIHHISMRVPIDELYVEYDCPKCGKYVKAINCGNNKDDVYAFYDPSLDKRYYRY